MPGQRAESRAESSNAKRRGHGGVKRTHGARGLQLIEGVGHGDGLVRLIDQGGISVDSREVAKENKDDVNGKEGDEVFFVGNRVGS